MTYDDPVDKAWNEGHCASQGELNPYPYGRRHDAWQRAKFLATRKEESNS